MLMFTLLQRYFLLGTQSSECNVIWILRPLNDGAVHLERKSGQLIWQIFYPDFP